MNISPSFDVIVVGAGPGGAAAKRCAEAGLKTLLIEKKTTAPGQSLFRNDHGAVGA